MVIKQFQFIKNIFLFKYKKNNFLALLLKIKIVIMNDLCVTNI